MNDLAILLEILAAAVVIAAPPILLSRLLAGGETAGLPSLFRLPAEDPWPRGVQEEEPGRWRPEALRRPLSAGDWALVPAREHGRLSRRAVTPDAETARCA